MKLNHLALFSRDTQADRLMFERHFGLRTLVDRNSTVIIMQDDNGFILMLNHFEKKLEGCDYPEKFDITHVGFIQENRDQVGALHKSLVAEGWETQAPHDYHGAWTFYFRAKGGFWVEVATRTPVPPEEAIAPAD